MRKFLMITVLLWGMSTSTAAAFNLAFDDLPSGTNVLDFYKDSQGIAFTSGLYVIGDGAYGDPDQGAMISSGIDVTMSILPGTGGLSFYFQGSVDLKAYGSKENLVFEDTPLWSENSWLNYGAFFSSAVYRVDFVVASEAFLIDAVTNEGLVVAEPPTMLLLGLGIIGLVTIRLRGKK